MNKKKLICVLTCLLLAIPCAARTITVDDDGPANYDNIQAAIDDSNDGDIIEVQPGTYTGDGNRDIDFGGRAITVRSIDPNDPNIVAATIIDCNGTIEEQHRGFYFHNNEDANSLLDGITVSNGYGPVENFYGYEQSIGGAILCYQSSPTISNCHLTNNSAGGVWGSGGAIACRDSDPIIIGCIITNNFIVADWGDGAGISCQYSSPIINNSIIAGNRIELTPGSVEAGLGGGIYCYSFSYPTISNSVISGNLILGLGWGGGIFCSVLANPVVSNCTFFRNSSTFGGALHCDQLTEPSIVNCILWGDDATYGPEISMTTLDWGSALSISFSNIQGGQTAIHDIDVLDWGPGNIDVDPCFVETGYWDPNGTPTDTNDDFWVDGDYHLLPGSPCIDAGDNNSVPADANDLDGDGNTTEPIPFDFDGELRFVDDPCTPDTGNGTPPIVDMGAFEFQLPDPVDLLLGLMEKVVDLNLQHGIANSLGAKLDAALKLLEDGNENNDVAALNLLQAFINAVEAQRGKKIPEAEADALIADVLEIIDLAVFAEE